MEGLMHAFEVRANKGGVTGKLCAQRVRQRFVFGKRQLKAYAVGLLILGVARVQTVVMPIEAQRCGSRSTVMIEGG